MTRNELSYESSGHYRLIKKKTIPPSFVQSDLVGHSFFDLVHPKDMAKVKEQLSFSDTMARGNVPSPKANAIAKHEATTRPGHLCSGARRSFFCRMKCSDKGKGPKDLDVLSSEPCLMNRKNKNKNSATAAQRKYAVGEWASSAA